MGICWKSGFVCLDLADHGALDVRERAAEQRERAAFAAGAVDLPAQRAVRPGDLDDLLGVRADQVGVQSRPGPRCSRSWRGPGRRNRRHRAHRATSRRVAAGPRACWQSGPAFSSSRITFSCTSRGAVRLARGRSATSRRSSSHQMALGTWICETVAWGYWNISM